MGRNVWTAGGALKGKNVWILLLAAIGALFTTPRARVPLESAGRSTAGPSSSLLASTVLTAGMQSSLTLPLPTSRKATPTERTPSELKAALQGLPLYFVENRGQVDPRVAYTVHGAGANAYFTGEGVTFALTGREKGEAAGTTPPVDMKRWAVKLDFVDANPDVRPRGRDAASARVSYFRGEPSNWKTGLPTYESIVYPDLWPGIDLVYLTRGKRLKYTFVVHPGADPNRIRLDYRGAESVRLTERGSLAVSTPVGSLEEEAPYAFQETSGKETPVDAAYDLDCPSASTACRYGFRVGAYDKKAPLFLDPLILTYAGYIGGAAQDNGTAIAVDSSGNAYIAGYTDSDQTGFPETVGPDLTYAGSTDAFVAKVNPSGTALIFCGYIGGTFPDYAQGIAVDASNNVYLVGQTQTTPANGFPVTLGPDLTHAGGFDAWVAKLDSSGTSLIYCGYIGGSGTNDYGSAIAIDSAGSAYVVGRTDSSSGFALVGPDTSYNGGTTDAFVAKVRADGTGLVYCGYIVGSAQDWGTGVAVDASGFAYVTGYTGSSSGFPVTGGPDLTYNGGSAPYGDAFVAKVSVTGAGPLVYCGYIGGSGDDFAWAIDVDSVGNAYVVGDTVSDEASFPVTGGPDLTLNGGEDAFIAKVGTTGSLVYCGYIGGSGSDGAKGIALDGAQNAYVAGYSSSANLPVARGPDLSQNGGTDAFVAKVRASGTALDYCGYIGGSGTDNAAGIAVDAFGSAYVTGITGSSAATFPEHMGPDLSFNGGVQDAFVAKVEDTFGSFSCRKPITIDRTKVGDAGTSTLSSYPMLFSVTDPNLRTTGYGGMVTSSSGYDILFRAEDTSTCGGASTCTLDHEIESYNQMTGQFIAWVRLPSVNGQAASSNTVIYVLYGNTNVTTSLENAAGVWNSSYAGVWHLKEDPSGSAPQMKDSTSNGNHATSGSAMTSADQVAGRVDGSLDFDGTDNDKINMADSASLDLTSTGTIEAWAYIEGFAGGTYGTIVEKYSGGPVGYQLLPNDTPAVRLYLGDGTGSSLVSDAGIFSYSTWVHLAVTWDGTNVRFYRNGAQFGASQAQPRNAAPNALPIQVGKDSGAPGGRFDGILDEMRISSSARSAAWIATEYNNHNNPGDVGAPGFYTVGSPDCNPTAVTLSSFGATGYDTAVRLEWTTASELNNLGFHLYRASTAEGPYERVTAWALPGLGSSPTGAQYRYTDTGLENGTTYFYKLEDIETTGKTELHGPVSAVPVAGNALASPPGSASQSGIVYGDPTGVSFRVLEETPRMMVLELVTGGFHADPQEDGSVELTVPGFVNESEPGEVSVPVWRSWLDVGTSGRVRVGAVRAEQVERFSSLNPSTAIAQEVVATARGTVELRRTKGAARARAYTREAAQVLQVGYQGELRKALVELSPLRWDPERGQLLLARRLIVRLLLSGAPERHRETRSHERETVLRRLLTRDKGLYQVSFLEVMGSRRRAVEASTLRLSRQREAVAFHIEPDDRVFGPGSVMYFLSEGSTLNPYGDYAAYELELGERTRMPIAQAFPPGPSVGFYWERLVREENRYYQAGLLEARDLWFWDVLFAPVRKSYIFEITSPAPRQEPSRLEIGLQGVSDLPERPDHHVRVYVNGMLLGETEFEGKAANKLSLEIPAGVLHEGANELELENVGDTGAAYSMVMLDRFEISYPRAPAARNGKLEGGFSESGVAEISGLSAGAIVLDATEAPPRWLKLPVNRPPAKLTLPVEAGRSYIAVDAGSVLRPAVVTPTASRLKSTLNRADYLVVGPRELLLAARPLLELRRQQGLRTREAPIEEVYSEFGGGESRPEAVREFLTYATHHWRRPSPQYVLLLGDGTYDFKDYLRTGVKNQVPPLMVKTTYLWTASDPAYAAVNGDDVLPDLAIGRLPAATVEEARRMVEKVLAYETSGSLSGGPVVLVADNPDDAGDFPANAEELASSILAGRRIEKIYLSLLGTGATRAAIVRGFDEGASLVSYIGHGGIHLWASENLLDTSQVAALRPQPQQPVALTLNCLNGYFHFPYFNSLSEELVKAEDKGAIAAFAPSGLSRNEPAHLFHKALLGELVSGRHQRLGDAVLRAQAAYAGTGPFPISCAFTTSSGIQRSRFGDFSAGVLPTVITVRRTAVGGALYQFVGPHPHARSATPLRFALRSG